MKSIPINSSFSTYCSKEKQWNYIAFQGHKIKDNDFLIQHKSTPLQFRRITVAKTKLPMRTLLYCHGTLKQNKPTTETLGNFHGHQDRQEDFSPDTPAPKPDIYPHKFQKQKPQERDGHILSSFSSQGNRFELQVVTNPWGSKWSSQSSVKNDTTRGLQVLVKILNTQEARSWMKQSFFFKKASTCKYKKLHAFHRSSFSCFIVCS